MVAQQLLELPVGVRVPARQPFFANAKNDPERDGKNIFFPSNRRTCKDDKIKNTDPLTSSSLYSGGARDDM